MIDPKALLKDAQKLVKTLAADIDTRLREQPDEEADLVAQHGQAVKQGRTGANYTDWRHERITQGAVAWVLACTFVRFLEDNHLLDERKLADAEDHQRAEDHLRAYFRAHPEGHERHYLHHIFSEVEALPAAAPLFDRAHNPLYSLPLSGDGAKELLAFWRKRDPQSGVLLHNFSEKHWDTRFLGDLYQDLSQDIRKKYALLQTPDFVEAFILDYTLDPAVATFGYEKVRLIDPTCGSGHFLLGAFQRMVALYKQHEPTKDPFAVAQAALNVVHGVDLNPYAVSIARFRLVIAALQVCGVTRLEQAPLFKLNLAAGDSLLHGKNIRENRGKQDELFEEFDTYKHVYEVEDRNALMAILDQTYHVVVGNPPYIVCRDPAQSQAYRDRYESTHRQYSLGVPFTERFFLLAQDGFSGKKPGYVGLITANSFMKREFGSKLITWLFPRVELTHIVDTSGAYIPGHGTPTVILIGRNKIIRAEEREFHSVKAVLGIRGEPTTPEDPAQGEVWQSIIRLIGEREAENDFVSVVEKLQSDFHIHPWSLSGGGSDKLLSILNMNPGKLKSKVKEIGFGAVTREDEVYFVGNGTMIRKGLIEHSLQLVEGSVVRDWLLQDPTIGIWPYEKETLKAKASSSLTKFLWNWKTQLSGRVAYGKTQLERGLKWFEYSMFFEKRFRTPLSITFAFVATHNHFVLDRGGKVFNRTAPVIKLPEGATEEAHLELLGLLNSSTACFWMKQVFADKGNGGIGGGIGDEMWERRFEHDGTKLKSFPISPEKPLALATLLDEKAQAFGEVQFERVFQNQNPTKELLFSIQQTQELLHKQMVFLQEELDWQCYHLYGLTENQLTYHQKDLTILPGERAFEIALARLAASGESKTIWFERHNITPITEVPSHWPPDYQTLVRKRLELIANSKNIRIIEQPEFKRRWIWRPFQTEAAKALGKWMLDYAENHRQWETPQLITVGKLADELRTDQALLEAMELYTGRKDFDLSNELSKLIASESVPALAVCRYKGKGLDNFAAWCRTWEQQRAEDAVDARTELPADHPNHLSKEAAEALKKEEIGQIPVPPKYKTGDFQKPTYFKLRGKLDVPKERFISFPHCERDGDPSLIIGWAGWDHLQRTQAVIDYYLDQKENKGWPAERLIPLLAVVAEWLPWVKQWHNQPDPSHGVRMGDEFAGFLAEELRDLGLTHQHLSAWQPPAKTGRKRKKTEAS